MIQSIDHVYYINLDYREKRRAFMESQISKLRSSYTRIPGVDCSNFINYKIADYIDTGSLRHKGTIGCFLAHQKCLLSIVQKENTSDDAYYLILEDDVLVDRFFLEEIMELELPKNWDIILMNCVGSLKDRSKPPPDRKYFFNQNICKIYTSYPTFLGAYCYILNQKTAHKILHKINNLIKYYDYDLFLYHNFDCYTYITDSVRHQDYKSDRDPEALYNSNKIDG